MCDDCVWLMILIALIRCMLTYNPRRSRLPHMFLSDVCGERTLVGEMMSAASVILPYGLHCSPCLGIPRIKRWPTDVVIGRVITALRAAVLGIMTPGGDTIQAVCPLFLGSGFAGHLVRLPQVPRWEWLVIEPPTRPLRLAAPDRRLAAGFRSGLLFAEHFGLIGIGE